MASNADRRSALPPRARLTKKRRAGMISGARSKRDELEMSSTQHDSCGRNALCLPRATLRRKGARGQRRSAAECSMLRLRHSTLPHFATQKRRRQFARQSPVVTSPRARSPTTSVSSCRCGPRLGTTYGAVEREPVGSKFVEERRWLFLETTSESVSNERGSGRGAPTQPRHGTFRLAGFLQDVLGTQSTPVL